MSRTLAAALGAALMVLVPAAATGAAERTSLGVGGLKATVTHEPFAISIRDRASGRVLRTLGETPDPASHRGRYGPLGYSFDMRVPVVNNAFLGYYAAAEVETLWFHATRVSEISRKARSIVLEAETNDPLGHRLEVTIAGRGEGIVTVHSRIAPGSGPLAGAASLSGAAFEAGPGERFLGYGERSNASDQTGTEVFSWAEEGPFSSGEGEDLLRPLVPGFTFPTGPTATNFPIPWQLSTRGFGFLIDQYERSRFRPRHERSDAWQAEAEAPELRFTVFAGPKPADALRRYSGWVGRQPDPAPWIFGPWFQPTLEDEPYELADRFRKDDVPVTVAQTYTHYLPCGAHVGRRDRERERVRNYHRRGYKITTYFNPHVCTTYEPVYSELADRGLFVENGLGRPYVLSNPFTADEQVSEFDFTNPEAEAYFQTLLDEAIDDGYDGWMEDFGEYTPTDSQFDNGRGGLQMHNRYPVIYHRASTRHTKERMGRDAAIYIRSGYHGVQPHARIVWGGDPTEDWSCSDGLCAALNQALSVGMSGIAYWGSDIGGFHAIVNPRTSDELNIRWLQLGAFSGVMRTQANGFSFQDDRAERSQVWHEAVYPIWRRYAKLRTQLLPYMEAASREYQRTGMPISRHMALTHPGDRAAVRASDQMMFGDDLLVAPVLHEGRRRRAVYLPGGRWVRLWQAARFAERPGTLRLRRARPIAGRRALSVRAPLEEIPVFVRAGAALAMLPADVDTLADVGSGAGLVKLAERRGRLRVLAFPRGRSVTRFGRRGILRSREGRRGWRLEIADSRSRRYRIEASLSTLRRPLRPCHVSFNGRVLPERAWDYGGRTRVLRAKVRGKGGALRVRGCR